jgi:hypothetical protein
MSAFSHNKPVSMKRYLVLDLEDDDRKFKGKMPVFWEKVSCANKKTKKQEGEHCVPVELVSVGASNRGDSISEPKEPKMSQAPLRDDFLADLFESPPPKAKPQPAKKSDELLEGTSAAPIKATSSGTVSSTPLPSAATVKPEDVVSSSKLPEPVTPSLSIPEPKDVVRKLVNENENENKDKVSPKKLEAWDMDILSDFDLDGFKKIIDRVVKNLANVDRSLCLEKVEKQLDEYQIALDLENQERLGSLGDKMARVQSLMDSLRLVLSKLTDWGDAAEKSWKYIESIGALYASASSREKRDAQVKVALGDFWLEYSNVTRIRDLYREQLEALKDQWNTLSRLITHDTNVNNTIRSISAGNLTESEKAAISEEVAKQISVMVSAQIGKKVVTSNDNERPKRNILDTEPSTDPLQFANLDNFSKNAAEVFESKNKKVKGEVDF